MRVLYESRSCCFPIWPLVSSAVPGIFVCALDRRLGRKYALLSWDLLVLWYYAGTVVECFSLHGFVAVEYLFPSVVVIIQCIFVTGFISSCLVFLCESVRNGRTAGKPLSRSEVELIWKESLAVKDARSCCFPIWPFSVKCGPRYFYLRFGPSFGKKIRVIKLGLIDFLILCWWGNCGW